MRKANKRLALSVPDMASPKMDSASLLYLSHSFERGKRERPNTFDSDFSNSLTTVFLKQNLGTLLNEKVLIKKRESSCLNPGQWWPI